jgi:hypothetical protein
VKTSATWQVLVGLSVALMQVLVLVVNPAPDTVVVIGLVVVPPPLVMTKVTGALLWPTRIDPALTSVRSMPEHARGRVRRRHGVDRAVGTTRHGVDGDAGAVDAVGRPVGQDVLDVAAGGGGGDGDGQQQTQACSAHEAPHRLPSPGVELTSVANPGRQRNFTN